MNTNRRLYETTFIINASLEDPQIDAIIDKVQDFIIKNNGEVKEMFKWGRKRFAFPIQKKNNGFYVVCEFDSSGDIISKLERFFTLEENILRSLVIKLDKKGIKARLGAAELTKQSTAEAFTAPLPPELVDLDLLPTLPLPDQE
jgi:small subunit ribosomal protein S6